MPNCERFPASAKYDDKTVVVDFRFTRVESWDDDFNIEEEAEGVEIAKLSIFGIEIPVEEIGPVTREVILELFDECDWDE